MKHVGLIIMLTIADIKQVYKKGVTLKFKRKPIPPDSNRFKGEFDPSTLEIKIYLSYQESKKDKELTILHEFVHARDDIKGHRYYRERRHSSVERETINTYHHRYYVLQFIKQLYRIR